ncbi:MAG: restriction endonuclease subunit S, partial [Clostridiales bacterium]|nr:restriction endonuclease subunit S [Clostridiales bacterium]
MSKMITCIPKIRFKDYLNDWLYTELKEVKDVRDGTHASPNYFFSGYPLVTSKNLTDSGLNLNDVSLISESDYIEINKRSKVEVGDILLGLIGTIGKPVLVKTDGFAIKNVGLIKNGGKVQNQFLLQYLKTNLFNKYIKIEMAGNTQKFLGLETLRSTKVPVPSPEEQSAIGYLFRTLDDLLASYKDNLANYQSLKATMLSKMFPKTGQTV